LVIPKGVGRAALKGLATVVELHRMTMSEILQAAKVAWVYWHGVFDGRECEASLFWKGNWTEDGLDVLLPCPGYPLCCFASRSGLLGIQESFGGKNP